MGAVASNTSPGAGVANAPSGGKASAAPSGVGAQADGGAGDDPQRLRAREYGPGGWLDLAALGVTDPGRVAAACVAMDTGIIGRDLVFPTPFHPRQVCTYADYTASGRAVRFVEEFVARSVLPTYANTHTEASHTGLCTSSLREQARRMVMDQTNCSPDRGPDGTGGDVCIFTGAGTTSAILHMIDVLGLRVPSNLEEVSGVDVRAAVEAKHGVAGVPLVLVTFMEHHSNEITWRECVADVMEVRERSDGDLDLDDLRDKLRRGVAEGRRLIIGSFSAGSNVTGIVPSVDAMVGILHEHGALAFLDFGASAPYVCMDMNPAPLAAPDPANRPDVPAGVSLAPDAAFLSPHKFPGGPGASGVLLAKRNLFTNRVPARPGGGTVAFVTPEQSFYDTHVEAREEGGTPGIVQDVRAGLALALKGTVGGRNVELIEAELIHRALAVWEHNPRIMLLGANRTAFWRRHRTSTVSFMFTLLPIDANEKQKLLTPEQQQQQQQQPQQQQGPTNAATTPRAGETVAGSGGGARHAVGTMSLRKPPRAGRRRDDGAPITAVGGATAAARSLVSAPPPSFGVHEYAGRADVRLPVQRRRRLGGIEDAHEGDRALVGCCSDGDGGPGSQEGTKQTKNRDKHTKAADENCCRQLPHGGFCGGKPFHFDARTALMLHPHFITQLLNDVYGIQSRSGCSCAGPYGHRLFDIGPRVSGLIRSGVEHGAWVLKPGWVRVNTNYFLSRSEFDFIVTAIDHAATHAWRLLPLYTVDVATGQFTHHSCVRSLLDDGGSGGGGGDDSHDDSSGVEWSQPRPGCAFELCKPRVGQLAAVTAAMAPVRSGGGKSPFLFAPQSQAFSGDLEAERESMLARADALYAAATATVLQKCHDAAAGGSIAATQEVRSPLRNFMPGQDHLWTEAVERTRWFALPLQHVASGNYFERARREACLLSAAAREAARPLDEAAGAMRPKAVSAAVAWAAAHMPAAAFLDDMVGDGNGDSVVEGRAQKEDEEAEEEEEGGGEEERVMPAENKEEKEEEEEGHKQAAAGARAAQKEKTMGTTSDCHPVAGSGGGGATGSTSTTDKALPRVQDLFQGEGYEWADMAPEHAGCVFKDRATTPS